MTTTETLERIDTTAPDRHVASTSTLSPVAALPATSPLQDSAARRRLRYARQFGPRCPDCGGPLVHGEGCRLCPICGHSSCG